MLDGRDIKGVDGLEMKLMFLNVSFNTVAYILLLYSIERFCMKSLKKNYFFISIQIDFFFQYNFRVKRASKA